MSTLLYFYDFGGIFPEQVCKLIKGLKGFGGFQLEIEGSLTGTHVKSL